MPDLSGLSYYGGKSGSSSTGTGRWIASKLPPRTDVLYCEPFAGQLGVLLQRPPSDLEIVNDANERLINWWHAVRDQPEEFEHLIQHTPWSRREFELAKAGLDDGTPIERALAFYTVVLQSAQHTDNGTHWTIRRNNNASVPLWQPGRVEKLAKRLRYVQLEKGDAVDILNSIQHMENAVVYCDPP